jgi:[ribosomal protein S18]-alanine N-acetyltransferase
MNLAIPEIRLARACDAEVIAAMSRDCIESGLVWSWTVPRVLRAIIDPASNVAVLAAGTTIVGFGVMSYGEDTAHLALLAVQSAYRSRGLGGRLLEWLEKPARVAGISRVRLEARSDNPRAIEFYRRCGYRVTARVPGYYQGCIDALRLEKTLFGCSDEAADPGRPHSQPS